MVTAIFMPLTRMEYFLNGMVPTWMISIGPNPGKTLIMRNLQILMVFIYTHQAAVANIGPFQSRPTEKCVLFWALPAGSLYCGDRGSTELICESPSPLNTDLGFAALGGSKFNMYVASSTGSLKRRAPRGMHTFHRIMGHY